ncbi:serine protease [Porphyromonas sp.]|uniref:trypsin-like serine peptidase n=1 Tax=Porphyromonas sp. TaxID=1924944 RepID=UPI0026DA9D91|nr:trypsin-like serine protease [Porphyromonas sp.]MDO4695848.1 trypsin-like serine protease [Porphyromonas sp.]MDO4771439.1 trypsin-like serine protease [Porphyromonas sp.]
MNKKTTAKTNTSEPKIEETQLEATLKEDLYAEENNFVAQEEDECSEEAFCPFELIDSEVGEVEVRDAIWGSYTKDELDKLLAEADAENDEPAQENILGKDDRVRIRAPKETFPYRSICSLRMTSQKGKRYIGTGFLVSPRIVVTAGHCVYFHKDGGWAKHIEVIPACDGGERPYGSVVTTTYCTLKGWRKNKNWNYDFAIIILPPNYPIGNRAGWFGYCHYNKKSAYNNIRIRVAGYPGDKGQGTELFTDVGKCKSFIFSSNKVAYKADTMGGQSGSPVGKVDRFSYAIAIHTNGGRRWNYGTKINKKIFDIISRYKKNFPG